MGIAKSSGAETWSVDKVLIHSSRATCGLLGQRTEFSYTINPIEGDATVDIWPDT